MSDNHSDAFGPGSREPDPSVPALRASIPIADEVFTIAYPFVRDTYSEFDGEGYSGALTWNPGTRMEPIGPEDAGAVADALGSATFTVVDVFKPGRFPMRVFFTRQFVNPDGKTFGKPRLHIVTLEKFRRLTRGYQHPFGIGEPLPCRSTGDRRLTQADFEQMLAEYVAQGISTGTAETLQAAQGEACEPGPEGVRPTSGSTPSSESTL